MVRSILGGIAGYVVLFIVMFATCTALYLSLGTDGAFQPGSYRVSMAWIVGSTVLSVIASLIAGYAASLIGNGFTAVKVLVGIILVMGAVAALMTVMGTDAVAARPADVPNMEAMTKAQTPLWIALISPIIAAVSAVIGGRLRKA
jgi:hypothetical protein